MKQDISTMNAIKDFLHESKVNDHLKFKPLQVLDNALDDITFYEEDEYYGLEQVYKYAGSLEEFFENILEGRYLTILSTMNRNKINVYSILVQYRQQ